MAGRLRRVRSLRDDLREVDPTSGRELALDDDAPWMAGMQLRLRAGDARLMLWPEVKL